MTTRAARSIDDSRRRSHHGEQPQPEIALLVSTFQKPHHLRLCLESILYQQGVAERLEVVVTDDGSEDETEQIVNEFSCRAPFPVAFTTHPHETFQLARCRNDGVRVSTAPYLLFLDGDCVLPRDHVAIHLAARRPGVVMTGDCCRLDEASSAKISLHAIRTACLQSLAPKAEKRRLAKRHRRAIWYRLINHPTKPRLAGNNVALWRIDYERVNGYDEIFEGWGCEDDDLGIRLKRSGMDIRSILGETYPIHVWHPPDCTAPAQWREGNNVHYLMCDDRPVRCRSGLEKSVQGDSKRRPAAVAA